LHSKRHERPGAQIYLARLRYEIKPRLLQYSSDGCFLTKSVQLCCPYQPGPDCFSPFPKVDRAQARRFFLRGLSEDRTPCHSKYYRGRMRRTGRYKKKDISLRENTELQIIFKGKGYLPPNFFPRGILPLDIFS
jgi:hypothetical protein